MKRYLIVNADDCNLTPGVTRAILKCHDSGILTSTTFMVNLPVAAQTVKELLRRKKLGLGIHLNVTFANPVSDPSRIPSLLGEGGQFKKLRDQITLLPRASELAFEYQDQIAKFEKIFGRMPTHLDTHHQVHDHPFFFKVLSQIAKDLRLPLRRSQLMRQPECSQGIRSSDHFLGNLTVEGHWRQESLISILSHLPDGTSEIMCHPGVHDSALESVSSFTTGRVVEYALFTSPQIRRLVESLGIGLISFKDVL